ncbi:sulfotransferase family cytosolic 1B member 1-like [Pomacea canaliculata]|uniref:sulfotransferase family cytosolic 1B member 1-like n=1 Tax=Pomacea canaliculata TaxID=400727 RepID=UPI000D72ACA6|nr:sulfotransferase family cytosolic 1B member 1-like [Pomacea canaliculata]
MTQVRVADGAGQSLRFLEVRGFMYPDFPIESIRGVPQLAIHADDVIICAYPKSGTHWLWEIARHLVAVGCQRDSSHEANQPRSSLDHLPALPVREKDDGMLEMMDHSQLDHHPSPRVLNTHVHFHQLPRQVLSSGCRVVLLTRDPRDVAVSYYNHHRKLSDLYDYHGDWSHYLPLFLDGKLDYGSWFEYYASWYQGLRENPDLKVLQLTYEDMKQDSCGGIKKLATFLDINCCSETLRLIDHVCSFDSMRQTKGHMEVDTAGQPIMYRKGNVGDWQEWFTVSQAETFARVYRQNISRWNLTASPAAQYIASVDHQ